MSMSTPNTLHRVPSTTTFYCICTYRTYSIALTSIFRTLTIWKWNEEKIWYHPNFFFFLVIQTKPILIFHLWQTFSEFRNLYSTFDERRWQISSINSCYFPCHFQTRNITSESSQTKNVVLLTYLGLCYPILDRVQKRLRGLVGGDRATLIQDTNRCQPFTTMTLLL